MIKDFWSGLVEADEKASTELCNIEDGARELDKQLTIFLEAIGKNGGKVSSIDIDFLQQRVFDDKQLLNFIVDKMNNGEHLNPSERELLYKYVQEELFGEEEFTKVDEISRLMAYSNEDLIEYINEEVLATEASLAQEIWLLELYLFAGNERPSRLNGSEEDRIRLHSYLSMLKNYQLLIYEIRSENNWERDDDEPLYAFIESLDFQFLKKPHRGHLETYIIISTNPEQNEHYNFSKEDFLENGGGPFDRHSISEVEYFTYPNAIDDLTEKHKFDEKEEINTYTGSFIASEVFQQLIGFIPNANFLFKGLSIVGEHEREIKTNEKKLKLEKLEQTASELHLELQLNKRNKDEDLEEIDLLLLPTESTFDLIDRWTAVHQVDGSFPYPENRIQNQDWSGINEFLYDENNKDNIKESQTGRMILDYILLGRISENPVVQEAINIIDGK